MTAERNMAQCGLILLIGGIIAYAYGLLPFMHTDVAAIGMAIGWLFMTSGTALLVCAYHISVAEHREELNRPIRFSCRIAEERPAYVDQPMIRAHASTGRGVSHRPLHSFTK